jgi:putative N6-adenine-specific DNA methylase
MTRHPCLAVCAPGIEGVCANELTAMGIRIRRTMIGGVEFSATDRQIYAANLWLRTANRVVVRIGRFVATTFEQLQGAAADLPWDTWIPDGTTPEFRVTSTSSRLSHTGAIAERLRAVVGRGSDPGPLVVVRVIHDRVTVSVDSSGDALYKRGWRQDISLAPLRETLAAAMLLASDWDPATALVDPMCGAGTIAIEGALLASGRPPGGGRSFAFMAWPCFAPGTWASVRATTPPKVKEMPPIIAVDHDAGAVAAAKANAQRAGVDIELHCAALSKLESPGGRGMLICNPPYGKRLSASKDLRDLYATLGKVVRARFGSWRVALLVADRRVAEHSGLAFQEAFRSENGGIPIRLLIRADDTVAT